MAEKIQYGMVIDTTRCMGCQTCVVQCKVAHQNPEGVYWSEVTTVGSDVNNKPTGQFPNPKLVFQPQSCNHCENPACVANCPTAAMHKREDGIVEVDQEVCVGCQYCIWNCPYEAPAFDPVKKTVSKCNFCIERVEEGEQPYCVESCPSEARVFGVLSDPSSEISKLIAAKDAKPLHPQYGTKPSVYYI